MPAADSVAEKKPAVADTTTAKPAADAAKKPVATQQATSLSANWLPAPEGDFYMVLRIYIPKENALNGTWKEPVVMRFNTDEVPAEGADAKAADTVKPADASAPVDGKQPGTSPAVNPEDAKPAAPAASPAATTPAVTSGVAPAPKATDTTAKPAADAAKKPVATQPATSPPAAKPAAATGGQSGTAQPAPKP
jgi:hypothetical protein